MNCPQCGAENYIWRSRCQSCNTLLHEEDKNTDFTKISSQDPLYLTASVSGFIGAVLLTIFIWFTLAFATGGIFEITGWLVVIGTGLVTIGTVITARKWPFTGGILLIIEGLAPLGLAVWSVAQNTSVFNFLMFVFILPGIPSITSGTIFLFLERER
jgi:hypothetical protein